MARESRQRSFPVNSFNNDKNYLQYTKPGCEGICCVDKSSLDRALKQRCDDLTLEQHKDDESGYQD
jgi:hypothetical protein